ncbi:hypothetical protein V1499_22940 (plasmid) [Neobacillus sp. SCS-31]|uniref:hypothetical protein n=1 Tax=Neobacillus oceani TaxID=3115292 RepID=UPI003905EA51
MDYDAMDEIDLIPSIIKTVEKILNGEKKTKAIKQWSQKWGLLNSDLTQPLEEIWLELYKIYKLWELYKGLANGDISLLKANIQLSDEIELDQDDVLIIESEDTYLKKAIIFKGEEFSVVEHHNFMKDDNNPESTVALFHLAETLEKELQNCTIFSHRMSISAGKDINDIKFTPALKVSTLKEAIYMQFYILLSENNQKICPVCNKPFSPNRIDQRYCIPKGPCYHTAKSRRYRKPKPPKILA